MTIEVPVPRFEGPVSGDETPEQEIARLRSVNATLQDAVNQLANESADLYQHFALRTQQKDKPDEFILSQSGLGIAGEAGEVADLIKKAVYHGHGLDREKLKKELGDVLWYVSSLADAAGFRLSEVMESNLDKLRARYPEGFFTTEASLARRDVAAK